MPAEVEGRAAARAESETDGICASGKRGGSRPPELVTAAMRAGPSQCGLRGRPGGRRLRRPPKARRFSCVRKMGHPSDGVFADYIYCGLTTKRRKECSATLLVILDSNGKIVFHEIFI